MRIAFAGSSGTGKSTLARWLVSSDGPKTTRGLPICPVGARSVARDMGFVGPDGEGRPYDVDRAPWHAYAHALGLPNSGEPARKALAAWMLGVSTDQQRRDAASAALRSADQCFSLEGSMRPFFQQRLADAKIAWERGETDFVTDRTSLDDCAYAILHCPEIATEAFINRALRHTCETYDLIFLCPMDAGQWLDGDAARVQDRDYHRRYEVVLNGLISGQHQHLRERVTVLWMPGLEERKGAIRAVLEEFPR